MGLDPTTSGLSPSAYRLVTQTSLDRDRTPQTVVLKLTKDSVVRAQLAIEAGVLDELRHVLRSAASYHTDRTTPAREKAAPLHLRLCDAAQRWLESHEELMEQYESDGEEEPGEEQKTPAVASTASLAQALASLFRLPS